ncbi:unnamed protein product, partial [Arabidopsis halleri]
MSGKKLFTVFIEAIHQELLAWTPKSRFVFKDFWHALGTKGVEQVVQTQHLEKEKEEFAEKEEGVEKVPEKEKEEHLVSWEKDGSVSVAYPDAMHIFKLENGLIHYSKWTASAATDETDFFDTEILEAEIGIRWDLKQKKKDKEEKEEDKDDDLGTKKTAADLRKLANDKQQLKKLLRELKKKEDELIEKVMKERKLEENKRKKEKKGK